MRARGSNQDFVFYLDLSLFSVFKCRQLHLTLLILSVCLEIWVISEVTELRVVRSKQGPHDNKVFRVFLLPSLTMCLRCVVLWRVLFFFGKVRIKVKKVSCRYFRWHEVVFHQLTVDTAHKLSVTLWGFLLIKKKEKWISQSVLFHPLPLFCWAFKGAVSRNWNFSDNLQSDLPIRY